MEEKGHSIYGNACLSRSSGEQCSFFGNCAYLEQFRQSGTDLGVENTIRIYTHAFLFLSRNEFERQTNPDLVIIDEAFLASAVSNLPSIPVSADTIQSRNVRLAKQYKALSKLIDIVAREVEDQGKDRFGQLVHDNRKTPHNRRKDEIVICEHKPIKVPRSTPVLYLDATADPIITEAYLPALNIIGLMSDNSPL